MMMLHIKRRNMINIRTICGKHPDIFDGINHGWDIIENFFTCLDEEGDFYYPCKECEKHSYTQLYLLSQIQI